MSSSTTGDPDGQALPNSMTQASMPVSAIPVTSPVGSIYQGSPVFPSVPVFNDPRENRIVLTQAEWIALKDFQVENQRLKKTIRNYGFAKAAMLSGIIMGGLMAIFCLIVIFGAIIEASGLGMGAQIKEQPGVSQTGAPGPTVSSIPSPTSSYNVGSHQATPSSQAKHATTVVGQTCVIIASGRRYCAQPAPSESGKACVVYPSGTHHCGTPTQGG